MAERSRLPDLGPRGEGWFVGQLVLLWACLVFGIREFSISLDGPVAWGLLLAGAVLLTAGAALLAAGIAALGHALTPMPRPRQDATLVDTGVYASVRHPVYGGLMLMAVGWAALTVKPLALLFAVLLCAWLVAKSHREEAWLEERFPGYAAYRLRAKRFLPGIY